MPSYAVDGAPEEIFTPWTGSSLVGNMNFGKGLVLKDKLYVWQTDGSDGCPTHGQIEVALGLQDANSTKFNADGYFVIIYNNLRIYESMLKRPELKGEIQTTLESLGLPQQGNWQL